MEGSAVEDDPYAITGITLSPDCKNLLLAGQSAQVCFFVNFSCQFEKKIQFWKYGEIYPQIIRFLASFETKYILKYCLN